MDTRAILNDAIIRDTVSKTSGYTHIKVECELKDIPEVHEIYKNKPLTIAEHLDGYSYNFGGRGYTLSKIGNGRLRYTGIIHTD